MALAARQAPQRRRIGRMLEDAETLRGAMMSMKARNRCKLIKRELGKLAGELPVTEIPHTTAAI
jgi:hypothetical protein